MNIHTYIHSYIYMNIHTYIYMNIHTYIHEYIRIYTHTRIYISSNVFNDYGNIWTLFQDENYLSRVSILKTSCEILTTRKYDRKNFS
jgi:hypothetical protein